MSDAMRGNFISSKVVLPRETGILHGGKVVQCIAKALISQAEEDTDGAGPAPEGGDAVGIGGDGIDLDGGRAEVERRQEGERGKLIFLGMRGEIWFQ